MDEAGPPRVAGRSVGLVRLLAGAVVVGVLGYAYAEGRAVDGASLVDYFGYFTNLTSLLTSVLLIVAGTSALRGRPAAGWLVSARAVAAACMIVVAVVYNVLVPGTGSAPVWVSAALHIGFPLFVIADWALAGDRDRLPWRRLWIVLPYPVTWLAVVLIRGATDGWVPYGFLLPERGLVSLIWHIVGLTGALLVAAALVWALSRLPAVTPRRSGTGLRVAP